ncbi:CDP-glucose 4,6-dehydratase [Candidatus Brocadiaceae bacterium]|nr:CDP-glucose 4,6-dehydratase [Candidatus Brocadiaceae bacterium]
MVFGDVYKGKTVFITGHTGFKGSWLSEWLLLLGANVVGYSLEPPTEPSLFAAVQLNERLTADIRGDVRSLDTIQARISKHTPDFIFHLAAQPLVRQAYDEPYETFETNVMGSLNVLEAVRRENRNCIVIMITTDKVYENVEWEYAYRENDPLGGRDPYSASKACAEISISAYRQSFFSNRQDIPGAPIIAVASVRGGNVIGGGDWAEGRIVPDCMKSLARNQIISVRNKSSTRPWQHVLELLSGYLHLGAEISGALTHQKFERLTALCSPFNFGPHITSNKTVEDIVQEILKHWPGDWEGLTEPDVRHEAGRLNLTIDKAYHTLGWQPRWNFEETIKHTVGWYRQYYQTEKPDPAFIRELTQQQILSYAERE